MHQAQRALFARGAVVTLAATGLAIGYFLGRALALHVAAGSLDQYAKMVAVQGDASSKEARELLRGLKKSPYAFCSESEIAYFRELVFRSEYLKDAGRIRDGKIDCSATAGHPAHAIGQFKGGSPQSDGTIAYSNLMPLRDDTLKRDGLQLGDYFVVFGAHMPASISSFPMHLAITMNPPPTPVSGASNLPGPSEGIVRAGDTLSATRCSALHMNCVTSSATISDCLRGEIGQVGACTILGGLAGVLFGLVFARARRRSLNLEQQLRRALAGNRLQVAYQPIVSLGNGQIVGAEALARWTNEEGVPVSPDVFIKLAEEHGFVGLITRQVLRRALQEFAQTLRDRPAFRLNVNVAAADLADPKFLPMLDDSLESAKVSPSSLAIEITESSTADREVAMESIRLLRRRGHSIYIDDFGTGYSSLSYLLYLSVDTIKIDKAFTRAIGTESVTVAILPQIMAMAKSLNLEVVVEGIETDQQALYFSNGTQRVYGQGWLYGRPISAEAFRALLAEQGERPILPAGVKDVQGVRPGVLPRPQVA
jgi:sensor c-di-GMP phosphodiesterase-like protein